MFQRGHGGTEVAPTSQVIRGTFEKTSFSLDLVGITNELALKLIPAKRSRRGTTKYVVSVEISTGLIFPSGCTIDGKSAMSAFPVRPNPSCPLQINAVTSVLRMAQQDST